MGIPEEAWLNGNPFYGEIFDVNNFRDRLRRDVARAFHDALPDAVAETLVDELLTAELYGDLIRFRIQAQVDPAIAVVINAIKELAVPYLDSNGQTCWMIPVTKLANLTSPYH